MAGAAAAVFAAPPISPSTPPTVPKRNLPLHFLSPSPPSTRRSRVRPLLVAASLESNLVSSLRERWMDFANLNCWVVRDYRRFVDFVNSLEPHVSRLSEEQLAAKTHEFRLRLRDGETLADIQAEAFSVVREAAERKLGMRHFDVQDNAAFNVLTYTK